MVGAAVRAELNLRATARRAVEIADVVLLCFDGQSQRSQRVLKVADWVRRRETDEIAVLRHSGTYAGSISQVAKSICRQIFQSPLGSTPTISAPNWPDRPSGYPSRGHSAAGEPFSPERVTPYHGPAERDFDHEREQYGVDYLARWSNFGILEALLTAGIAAGGAQLRLHVAARACAPSSTTRPSRLRLSLSATLDERFAEVDRAVSRHFEGLGYLELDERGTFLQDEQWSGDLLSIAETARRAPYRSPADGTFSRYVRSPQKPQLSVPRNAGDPTVQDLEHDAWASVTDIDQDLRRGVR